MAWRANMDIQPVFNHYKAVSYMCAYFSKSEDETSKAMKLAAKEASENHLNNYEQMKSIAQAYATKSECSVQEAVYHIMPELWMRKCFPGIVFVNSNLPEDRYKIFKSEEVLSELPADSTDIYKRNMLDRYLDRPHKTFKNGKYGIIDQMCYAEFLSRYYLDSKLQDDTINDNQPEVLTNDITELNHDKNNYPATIPLMSSKERLKCRKVKSALRYHIPNRHRYPEKYSHHVLFMSYPFRNEDDLRSSDTGLYMDKLLEEEVLNIVNHNKEIFEPYGQLVDDAIKSYRDDAINNQDACAQQENDDVLEKLQNTAISDEDSEDEATIFDDSNLTAAAIQIPILSDDEINHRIRSLNIKQWEIFDFVHKWAKDYVKNLGSKNPIDINPLHLFISGSGGVGKSHLIKTLYQTLTKLFCYCNGDPNKPKVLLLAPTGVAAVNIEGTTIHTSLGIPIGNYSRKCLPKLNDKMKSSLRNNLSELHVIVIDEISMVSNVLLLNIHQRLAEIFGTSSEVPFAGKTILVLADFYQLPPVKSRRVYEHFQGRNEILNMSLLWRKFEFVELTEVMRQRGDTTFIELLNRIRTGEPTDADENALKSRFITKDDPNYPLNELHACRKCTWKTT